LGERIESKTMTMFSLMTGALITLCGYIISNWSDEAPISNKAWIAILGVIYILSVSIYILRNILTDRYFMLGLEENQRRLRLLGHSMALLLFLPVFLGIAFGIMQWLG